MTAGRAVFGREVDQYEDDTRTTARRGTRGRNWFGHRKM
jgi:hypothetical protein